MKRVLVLGGTGHLGSAITRELDAAGYIVSAAGHRPGPRANLEGCSATLIHGDDRDPQTLQSWIHGFDSVIDAATPYPLSAFGGAGGGNPVSVAIDRTQALVAAVRRENARLIHISSFTTLASAGSSTSRLKQTVVQGLHPYFEVKDRVEKQIAEALRQGVEGCIVNPTACFGPWDMKSPEMCFIPLLLTGKVPALVRRTINVIDVRDVARAVLAEIQSDCSHDQITLSGHNIAVDALAARICELGDARPPALRGSSLLGAAGLFWAESLFAIAGRESPWPSLPMLLTAVSRQMDVSPEQRALGIQPRDLEDTLRDAVSWYRSIGYC